MYWLYTLHGAALLDEVLRHFGDSVVAVETDGLGPLLTALLSLTGASAGVIAPFRPTHGPTSQMVVVPVDRGSADRLLRILTPDGRVAADVGAVHVAHEGSVQLLAGDNFHPKCVSVGSQVSVPFLERLVEKAIIREFASLVNAQSWDEHI